eukprot:TRINITY_DN3713_c0_g2_i1.p1 TRINITY_DN3713_c0_g2~~TRINITY_DN3713_c0_g2_i1.p1  ORF type:complete len:698 (+),score=181.19 TRINITY_DN3713_c0_g2_i1:88-2094(+)
MLGALHLVRHSSASHQVAESGSPLSSALSCTPRARLRAAFAVHDPECTGTVPGYSARDILERLGCSRELVQEALAQLREEQDAAGRVPYEAFVKWQQHGGAGSFLHKAKLFGQEDIGVFSRRDDDVDEYDGLKIIARNRTFGTGQMALNVVSILTACVKEFNDIFQPEAVIGCSGNASDLTDPGRFDIHMDHCFEAGLGGKDCYPDWEVKTAGGDSRGDIIVFSSFILIIATLVLLRYLLWRDQALCFELLQYQVFVECEQLRYWLWLLVLGIEVLAYGSMKLWLNDRREHGEYIQAGLAADCNFAPDRVRLRNHTGTWFDAFHSMVIFGLVLQAPVRDVTLAASNLYYQVSIKHLLFCGHPRPDRLLRGFRTTNLCDLLRYLGTARFMPQGCGYSRPLDDFVQQDNVLRPVDSGKREHWEEVMTQAYKMAGKEPAAPGTECRHRPSCFRSDFTPGPRARAGALFGPLPTGDPVPQLNIQELRPAAEPPPDRGTPPEAATERRPAAEPPPDRGTPPDAATEPAASAPEPVCSRLEPPPPVGRSPGDSFLQQLSPPEPPPQSAPASSSLLCSAAARRTAASALLRVVLPPNRPPAPSPPHRRHRVAQEQPTALPPPLPPPPPLPGPAACSAPRGAAAAPLAAQLARAAAPRDARWADWAAGRAPQEPAG